MKQEKIERLLYYYIEERTKNDVVDGASHEYCDCATDIDQNIRSILAENTVINASLAPADQEHLSSIGRKLAQFTEEFFSNCSEKSNIKFENKWLFVTPIKQIIFLPVIRTSDTDEVLRVSWKTCDRTAVHNMHYTAASGEIVFEKNETKKILEIEILDFLNDDDDIDLRFQVQLSVENAEFNPRPITVTIKNTDNFNEDEKQVMKCLLDSKDTSVNSLLFILNNKLNHHTFKIALSYLCSTADSLPLEVGLACELTLLCMKYLPFHVVRNTLTDFFRFLPDDFQI